jgi:glucose/arabinose dehydrogenase
MPAIDALSPPTPTDEAADMAPPSPPFDAPGGAFCALGTNVGGAVVPAGFCLRRFATVPEVRTIAFAPNGDLVVGAPSMPTAGGSAGGPGAILVLSDDDRDGRAEINTFAPGIPDVHGIAIGGGYLYFTTTLAVFRTPFADGQRKEGSGRESLGVPASFGRGGRWTHGLARSVGGQLMASRGEYATCGTSAGGEISLVGMGSFQLVAKGFRNPMYMRCHFKDEVCGASELGEDQMPGAREKLIVLRPDTDYGYPCCYTMDRRAPASNRTCADVAREDAEFTLADTPFGLDWERDLWPAPYKSGVFVALHGSFYSSPAWAGARIVFARTDPQTHAPAEPWSNFVTGFGPGGSMLDRPSDVAFAPDGRMFFSDDQGGAIYWVAPTTLPIPN